ncbi:MAG: spermine synthase [Lyngbya sp. HA4199-MV5]|jgi:spermidine synthase|nr:spermine synthase [Lyngbya sp. HA4199-MV5]
MTSLFIEHHPNGLAFYINGDLQFDTADEAIYHEYLVVPAIALAVQRFPNTPLRVLICGGGDGLAARDVLRFDAVSDVTLVDYDAEVLELGRTVFEPYNQGSLISGLEPASGKNRLTVYTQEAFEFVANVPDACYHAVICDFTFPSRSEDTQIYSREWFQQVHRVLCPGGIMSTNGVSPEQRTLGFWCLYQTLLAAALQAKPLQVAIPSFREHGYGDWGFFIASEVPMTRSEVEAVDLPANLSALQPYRWQTVFQIPTTIAQHREVPKVHTLDSPQLFYYLLNPRLQLTTTLIDDSAPQFIDFLDVQEEGTGAIGTHDLLQLDAIATAWLDQLHQAKKFPQAAQSAEMLPVQHRYHSPQMTTEWLTYLKALLEEVNLNQLLASLLERAQELPPQLARELKQLTEKIRTGQPITYISEHTAELITLLSVTVLMANVATPDIVFAKGYSGSSRGYSSSGSSGDENFGWLGFWTMLIGGIWLWNLYKNPDE